jgi:hypothetical protein
MKSNLAYALNDEEMAYFDAYAKKYARKMYLRDWKNKNREHVNQQQRLWEKNNPEKIRAYQNTSARKAWKKSYCATYYENRPELVRKRSMLNTAKHNASKKGRPFTITFNDVIWNDVCPVFGTKLNYGKPSNGKNSYDSPSLDCTIPSLGYVPGNVVVMSWRANRIKADGSLAELEKLLEYMRKKETENAK